MCEFKAIFAQRGVVLNETNPFFQATKGWDSVHKLHILSPILIIQVLGKKPAGVTEQYKQDKVAGLPNISRPAASCHFNTIFPLIMGIMIAFCPNKKTGFFWESGGKDWWRDGGEGGGYTKYHLFRNGYKGGGISSMYGFRGVKCPRKQSVGRVGFEPSFCGVNLSKLGLENSFFIPKAMYVIESSLESLYDWRT